MPKKARVAALRSALAQRLQEGALRVVEGFPVEAPKTRALKALLAGLEVTGKAVIVDHEPSDALVLSSRNLQGVKVVADTQLTAYDVLDCAQLLISQEAVEGLEHRLAPEDRG
jgi:large subunit ribosomal protein L4